jgi:hypothetical protein
MSYFKKYLEIINEVNQDQQKFQYDNMGQIINLNENLAKKLNLIEIEYIRKRFVSLHTKSENDGKSYIICAAGRFIVLKKINNVDMIFYLSTGKGGKKSPAGKWYPVFGISGGWINKAKDSFIMEYYGSKILKTECEIFDNNIGDIRNLKNIDPINISINDGEKQTEVLNKGKKPSHETDPVRTFKNMYTIINKIDPNNTFKNLFSKDNTEGFTLDFYNKISSNKISSNEREKFEKDLSKFKDENEITSEILKAFNFIEKKKINDFIVTFKKGNKSVIVDVKDQEYSVGIINYKSSFNYKLDFLRQISDIINVQL